MAAQRGRSIAGLPLRTALPVGAAAFALVVFAYVALGSGRDVSPPGTASLDLVVAELEERVRTDPQDPEARIAVAIAYAERGLTQEAIAQYEQALVLEPDHQTALIGLGQAQLQLGNLDAAEQSLGRVAELNADNEQRYIIDQLQGVYYDLARIAMEREQWEAARDYLDEALRINTTDADSWFVLGGVYERLGEVDEAEASYQVAVRLVPDYLEVYQALEALYRSAGNERGTAYAEGMIALANGRTSDAITSLERAAAGEPPMAQAHEGLGVAYEAAGRPDDALAQYQTALEIDPEMFLSNLAVDRLTGS